MKNRVSMLLGLAVAMFLVSSLNYYCKAQTAAGQWRSLGRQQQDNDRFDVDNLSSQQAADMVSVETAGSADMERWPLSNGAESLVVLENLLSAHAWWQSWRMCDRLLAENPVDTVAVMVQEVQADLRLSIASASLALLTVAGLGLVQRS